MASPETMLPYAERLLDDYILENGGEAVAHLGAAIRRARRKPSKALNDRRLQRQLHDGMESLRKTALALQGGQPKPRRSPKLLLVLVAGVATGTGVLLVKNDDIRNRLLTAVAGITNRD